MTMSLLRFQKAFKFSAVIRYPSTTISVNIKHRYCELCGRRDYSTDDSRRMKLRKVLKDGDSEKRFTVHSTKVQSLTEEDLLERFRNLESLSIVNYDTLDALPLLSKHPFTIRNRVELLLESGFLKDKISAYNLSKYITLVKQRKISELKKQNFIPDNLDVMSHMLQFIDLEPKFYPNDLLDKDATINLLRIEIVRAFLKRRFGVTDEELKIRGQNITRLWNKSFGTINKNIRLIEDGVGMPTQSLRKHLYLLALNPANLETILREVKMVGNLDIYTALKTRPKIICNSCGNLHKILKLLEKYEIPSIFNHGALKLLTLSYTTIEERLEELDKVEYFSLNKSHPRILNLITEQNAARKRLKILEECNISPGSLNSLITNRQMFQRYLTEGHYNNGRDLLYFLSHQYGVDTAELKKLLEKHPYWTSVSLVTVGRNHKFLSKYLTRNEIVKSPLVLFYPCEKVQEAFFSLETRDGVDSCRGEDGRIKPEFVVPLLTYFLEKEANFTFQGIWLGHDTTGSEASDAPHVFTIPSEDQS